jgi:putative tricarboxylic transport membrane protein
MTKLTRAAISELIFSASFLLLGFFVLYSAFNLEEPGVYSVVSPKTFAYIIGVFTSVVGILLVIEVVRGNYGVAEGTERGDPFLPPDIKTMAIVLTSIALHILLIQRAGYIAAAAIAFYGVSFAFGSRKILKDILVAFVFAITVYVVFSKGLRIFLPEGFFENLLGLARKEG